MRGEERQQRSMLMVLNLEQRVSKEHPLRRIKQLSETVLKQLSPTFDRMYSASGRPSIPPERLLKASLLMALYTVRSERLLCEQLDYNLLFRWFLDMELDEVSFDHSSFSANRKRLLEHAVAGEFFRGVLGQARALKLLCGEHFTVDGTLIEAWASLKSFRRRDETPGDGPDDPGNPTVNFHGERRSNETHQSTTDPEALLARKGKGKEAKLYYSGNALAENRNFLVVDFQIEPADGGAAGGGGGRITVAGDKGYDTRGFVATCRALNITPHVAQNLARPGGSALDARTTRHPGYAVSQRLRKRIEEAFGWMKTVGGLRQTRYRGRERVQMHAYLVAAAYNLLRIARLAPAPA
ncbi:MAG: IS5 family transposase [Candidatus Binataceae bacterium]